MRLRRPLQSPHLRVVLRDVGAVIPVVGLMALASIVVCLVFRETYAVVPLVLTAAISFALGACLYFPFRRAGESRLRHALLAAAIVWAIAMFLGGLPFYFTAHLVPSGSPASNVELSYFRDMASSFFESVSGFSTTGLSMTLRPIDLPRTLQWWRMFLQWIGGLGVVVLMLTVIASGGTKTSILYFAEREDRTHPSIMTTARTLWWIYVLYTVGGVLALWAVKMPLWDALHHSMTALATGGFALDPTSIEAYRSLSVELILCVLMLLGGMNFAVHYELLRGRGRLLWQDPQTRAYLLLVGFWFVGLSLQNYFAMPAFSVGKVARLSFFQGVSAMTTTGFQTTMPLSSWSETAKLILIAAMFVGSCTGSTGGGIKVLRALLLVRGLRWQLRRSLAAPSEVVPFRFGRQTLSVEEGDRRVRAAALLTFLWMGGIVIGVLVLLQTVPREYTLGDIVLEVTSAQSNVGLSSGITGPTMSTWAKVMLSLNMLTGRFEIIPALLVLRSLFRGFR